MKASWILVGVFALLALNAYAARDDLSSDIDIVGAKAECLDIASSTQDLKLDIVGSVAQDIRITVPDGAEKDIEIVGGSAKNIEIVAPKKDHKKRCYYDCYPKCPVYYACNPSDYCKPNYCPDNNYNPYGQHFGVDAWHGTYWYASGLNTPKWPQVFGGA